MIQQILLFPKLRMELLYPGLLCLHLAKMHCLSKGPRDQRQLYQQLNQVILQGVDPERVLGALDQVRQEAQGQVSDAQEQARRFVEERSSLVQLQAQEFVQNIQDTAAAHVTQAQAASQEAAHAIHRLEQQNRDLQQQVQQHLDMQLLMQQLQEQRREAQEAVFAAQASASRSSHDPPRQNDSDLNRTCETMQALVATVTQTMQGLQETVKELKEQRVT